MNFLRRITGARAPPGLADTTPCSPLAASHACGREEEQAQGQARATAEAALNAPDCAEALGPEEMAVDKAETDHDYVNLPRSEHGNVMDSKFWQDFCEAPVNKARRFSRPIGATTNNEDDEEPHGKGKNPPTHGVLRIK